MVISPSFSGCYMTYSRDRDEAEAFLRGHPDKYAWLLDTQEYGVYSEEISDVKWFSGYDPIGMEVW